MNAVDLPLGCGSSPAKPTPSPTDSGLRRAIEVAGSELNLAAAINIPASVISWWLYSQNSPAAQVCIRIEDCTCIPCEELRPDLHWIRLGDEVVGHIVPVDGASSAYVEEVLRSARPADTGAIRRAMIDGMLYGLDDERSRALLEFYRVDEPGVEVDLESLLHDLYFERQDASYYQAWGITYALNDHVREDLMRRHPVFQAIRAATEEELERLQQEVDALRWLEKPRAYTGMTTNPLPGSGRTQK
jgi:DNA-binding transcriptional regulator YdaS (Cro superfamily)